MSNIAVLDLFLGDSGKGKIVDYLAEKSMSVIRFNGSNNAGHTLTVKGKEYKTHCIPSGVLYPHTTNFIAHGCAMDPYVLTKELEEFRSHNGAIYISGQAHIILPYHIQLDVDRESGSSAIGSTRRGVAPAYEAKASRRGLRYEDLLLSREEFLAKAKRAYEGMNPVSRGYVEAEKLYDTVSSTLRPHIIKDGISFAHELASRGPMVFEGAQGCFLDVDCGAYPYVTSSNCTVGSILTGTGLNLNHVDEVIGVVKAYGSYVGTNPDFNDIKDQVLNDALSTLGKEFGTTTGRRRRLCWLDLDQISRAVKINGPTGLAITRLDTLGQMSEIQVKWQDTYVKFDPWGDLSGITDMQQLPSTAHQYLNFIEHSLKVPIWAVGIGPNRDDLLLGR